MRTNVLLVTLIGTFIKRSKNSSSLLITLSSSHGSMLKLSTGWYMDIERKNSLCWNKRRFNGMSLSIRYKVMENMLLYIWRMSKFWTIKLSAETVWKSQLSNSSKCNQFKWASNNNQKNNNHFKTNNKNKSLLPPIKESLPKNNWTIF